MHLHDIRALYIKKSDLLDPVSQLLKDLCGQESYYREVDSEVRESREAAEDDEISGDEDIAWEDDHPYAYDHLCDSPEMAVLNYWIYCELFHHHVDYALIGSSRAKSMPEPLSMDTRERFFAYCIPES